MQMAHTTHERRLVGVARLDEIFGDKNILRSRSVALNIQPHATLNLGISQTYQAIALVTRRGEYDLGPTFASQPVVELHGARIYVGEAFN